MGDFERLAVAPVIVRGVSPCRVWASEADRSAVQTGGALQEQIAKFAAVLAVPAAPATYEIRVQA